MSHVIASLQGLFNDTNAVPTPDLSISHCSVTYKVHNFLLSLHSEYFHKLCRSDFKETQNAVLELDLVHIPPEIFESFLKWFYGFELHVNDCSSVLSWWILSDYFQVGKLQDLLKTRLKDFVSDTKQIIRLLQDGSQHSCSSFMQVLSQFVPLFPDIRPFLLPLESVVILVESLSKNVETHNWLVQMLLEVLEDGSNNNDLVLSILKHLDFKYIDPSTISTLEHCLEVHSITTNNEVKENLFNAYKHHALSKKASQKVTRSNRTLVRSRLVV
ncbi:hypothetical protein P9112_000811 [Eukaryota sp. TZLM1-RC]